jgi:menaquinone-9 beta-reductase
MRVGEASTQPDVVVIGAGPAGIAAAIAARLRGFHTTVIDARVPPIDKPCGEGLLPHGVAALQELGIRLNSEIALPFTGIRFADRESSASSTFLGATGFSLRRVRLHEILVQRAVQAGVDFLWGARVERIDTDFVVVNQARIPYTWLVGADGQNSLVRKWAGLDAQIMSRRRFGFRKHFQIHPWTSFVEVYWDKGYQIVVTPTGAKEVGVAVISRDHDLRVEKAVSRFPALADRLKGATPTTKEMGDVTSLTRFPAVTQGRIALTGDASGTVDAVTGHGLSLSFQEALHLAKAFQLGDLKSYEAAHRNISAIPATMTRLMLAMGGSDWIRRRTIRLLRNRPGLFSKLLSMHTEIGRAHV